VAAKLRLLILAAVLLACSACSRSPVLVVGLDGADWDVMDPLMEAGLLPNIRRIVRRGVRAQLDCVPALPETPCFCPPVWNTLATGHPAAVHGIYRGSQFPNERAVKAIWNVLKEDGGTTTTLSVRNSFPAEEDIDVVFTDAGLNYASYEIYDRWPGEPQGWDLWKVLHTKPEGLFEALGLLPHVGERPPVWAMIARDRVAMEALSRLAPMIQTDLTMILVHSTDKTQHLNWSTIQTDVNEPVDAERVISRGEQYSGPWEGPPPWSFGTAVSQYLEADAWLGELLRSADYPYVVLVSDHGMTLNAGAGFSGQHGPEFPEAHEGILAIHGPGVRWNSDLGTVSLLDVAPTLAYLLGLPVPDDLPGRLLEEAFYRARLRYDPVQRVATWED